MTSRIEVFLRSGHTIDLALEDGADQVFKKELHDAWASTESVGGPTVLALGENAVVLAADVVGYRLHGTVRPDATRL